MFNRHGVPRARIDFLRTVPLFAGLPDRVLERLDAHLDDIDIASGATLTFQGERGYETFVVVEGTAEVLVNGEKVNEVGSGEIIGEIAVLEQRDRTATVRAATPMRVLVVPSREIGWLFSDPELSDRVRQQLADHLGQATPSSDA